ncbi:MAG: DUF5658 family protein [Woeseia sp.]
MERAAHYPDYRCRPDRRTFNWRTVVVGFVRSRRRNSRRSAEGEAMFSDWHHPWLFFLAIGIMLLSSADAFMTLTLIDLGANEANPLMHRAMEQSMASFTSIKMALTAFGVLALVFLARARLLNLFRAGAVLTAVFSMYACLICYELIMLWEIQ